DDATLLVYSDWLEEQGDATAEAKAEFLRLTAAEGGPAEKKRGERLQALAAALDTGWLAVVSRLRIENCAEKRKEGVPRVRVRPPLRFHFLCDRKWEDLRAT